MGRYRKALTGLGGLAVVGTGGMLFYQNMFIDRHAIVSLSFFVSLFYVLPLDMLKSY
jgi:hypothetical protein